MRLKPRTLTASLILFFVFTSIAAADFLRVSRKATIKAQPDRDATILHRVDRGAELQLLEDEKTNGYYKVALPTGQGHGWIYKSLARRYTGDLTTSDEATTVESLPQTITIASFNIKFLGHYKKKRPDELADLVKDYDIVVVQEMVSPPVAGVYPDGEMYEADAEAQDFLIAMQTFGFEMALSPEDTGTSETIHKITSSTEWFATFYKDTVRLAADLPNGFLADDRSAHGVYQRVPYATGFRSTDGNLDFVLINVHLCANDNQDAVRLAELQEIVAWIEDNDQVERDFIILGDMNMKNGVEVAAVTSVIGFDSLNDDAVKTNTSPNTDKPYDHVMYQPQFTSEMDTNFGFHVVDLIGEMENLWSESTPYPGNPYDGTLFPQFYSDHHPVVFRLRVPMSDDD